MPNTEQSIEETGGVPEIEMEVEVFGMVQYPTDKTLSQADMAADAKAVGEAIGNVEASISDLEADFSGEIERVETSIAETKTELEQEIVTAFARMYPVGSVYISTLETLPMEIAQVGVWEEIAMPLTWADIRTGSRSYMPPEGGFQPGNLHIWLRTS